MQTIIQTLPKQKNIALVAHDGKKTALKNWCFTHKSILHTHNLYATGTTGLVIEKTTGLCVEKLLSGPMGGDQQIGAKIAEHQIHMLIFFWDPLASQPHDPDVKALLRLAAVWNIPVACNEVTADILISSQVMDQEVSRNLPDYQSYLATRLD
ncbi:Methylglyoxal synthase [Pseudoalteromonas holothuriae]|uniref:Methylglyoxal synthase n=1 Tax=Pseudoalteromonas holothuriae TaxID=2963714 RepID=A0A9W4QZE1_9GAMM|nr:MULTISPECIES: methylglyoxal synthase [unclassified Pseudoalteromonas]CAH9059592.1 Methylglyoxal synthase [Pseudoalteromonas sp. CIP111854]CAH9064236.1 Methylglyoxal synthase [Pseudoalteromonas sp. CIP111951]